MDYKYYYESVARQSDGTYTVTVEYARDNVEYEQTGVVDNVSDGYALIRTFRAQFRERLNASKQTPALAVTTL